VERHGYLGTFVETGAWKYLRHACDTAINEQAIARSWPKVAAARLMV
jgi:hypothetical protein